MIATPTTVQELGTVAGSTSQLCFKEILPITRSVRYSYDSYTFVV